MATTSRDDRSQPILRIPRDQTPVTLTLEGGERANAMLFVPPGASVKRWLADAAPFVPVSFSSGTRLVARDSIACITVHVIHAHVEEFEMLGEKQKALVRLKGGQMTRGELRWIPETENRRTLDLLNDQSTHLVIYVDDFVSYIAKSHVASVEEL
jgi:hypothetical protein